MCGFVGIVQHNNGQVVNLEVLQKATTVLRHRGPDDEGYLLYNLHSNQCLACGGQDTTPELELPDISDLDQMPVHVALGFRRLSILDLSPSGHQPMPSGDGRYWIVFNGEIYNYVELREELRDKGHTFYSDTDTEVIVAGYVEWGPRVLSRLTGMFALSILDTVARKLFIARDCFGIKPFFYTKVGDTCCFAFASEIKALLELPWVIPSANPEALYNYLNFGYTDYDFTTFFTDIYQLPPAHYLEIDLDSSTWPEPVKYWQLSWHHQEVSFEHAANRLRELFFENIRLHLRSDVPVAAALSGGVDSTSIVSCMRYLQGKNVDIHTFSYISDDPVMNEEQWIDIVCSATDSTSHKIRPEAAELASTLDAFIYTQEQPVRGIGTYVHYLIFRLVKEIGIKVTLDGQGGDELFGGYNNHLPARFLSIFHEQNFFSALRFLKQIRKRPGISLPQFIRSTVEQMSPPQIQRRVRLFQNEYLLPTFIEKDWFLERGVSQNLSFTSEFTSETLKHELFRSLTTTILPRLLRQEDRNSMAHSIESRVPFLTPKLAEFVFSLPEEYLIAPDGTGKAVFRQAMKGIVPDAVLERKLKVGFGVPEGRWLFSVNHWIRTILESEVAAQIPFLEINSVKKDFEAMTQGRKRYDYRRVWYWINLIRWTEQYKVRFDR